MPSLLSNVRRTLWLSLDHDAFNTAKAAAYSAMLCLFPGVLVVTTLLAEVPEGRSLMGLLRGSFDQVVPSDSLGLLQDSITANHLQAQVAVSAALLAAVAGVGVMLSLIEGFRRAYRLRRDSWGFWEKGLRALMLVPIVLLPLCLASLLLVFGHQIELWMIARSDHELRTLVLIAWRMLRWGLAVLTGTSVLAALYHFGTRRTEHWAWVLPGAMAATLLWFAETLAFGWYVTRMANYSRFYGPFAAGIATLVWLYMTSFSALLGAEFNGVLYQQRKDRLEPQPDEIAPASSSATESRQALTQ